jgi:transcriptional regulator with XRE-family HTH domain
MRAPTVAANSLLALLVDTPLLYRRMAASASSPSKVPMTDRLAALRLQVVATEMSVRIGNRIRQRREELGIKTQRELANLIPIDSVTNQTVNKWEKGVHEPGPQYKMLLAQALQVDVAYFIAEEPQGATPNPFPPANGGDDRLDRIEAAVSELRREREQGIAEVQALLRRQDAVLERIEQAITREGESARRNDESARRLDEAVQRARQLLVGGTPDPAPAPRRRAKSGSQ